LAALSFGFSLGLLIYDVFNEIMPSIVLGLLVTIVSFLVLGRKIPKKIKKEAGLFIEHRKPEEIKTWASGREELKHSKKYPFT
jgi:Mg2+/citrate symporter